jgi:hypothetical protein
MLPPSLPSQVSESRTKERPSTQSVPPPNCHREYLVPRNIHVSRITQGTTQQSNNVTLVIELY